LIGAAPKRTIDRAGFASGKNLAYASLPVLAANNETGVVQLIDRPRRREAAGGGHRGIIWQKRTRVITPVADTFSSSSVKSMTPA
jgi:hypothetical protein